MQTYQNNRTLWFFVVFLAVSLIYVQGCSGNDRKPVSPEQRAFATYGYFTALEETAAKIVSSPYVGEEVIQHLRAADSVAKPLADSMYNAAVALKTLRDAKAPTAEAEQALIAAYTEAVTAINAFDSIIREWKEVNGDPSNPSLPLP